VGSPDPATLPAAPVLAVLRPGREVEAARLDLEGEVELEEGKVGRRTPCAARALVQRSAVQCAVQCSAVCGAVQCGAVRSSALQWSSAVPATRCGGRARLGAGGELAVSRARLGRPLTQPRAHIRFVLGYKSYFSYPAQAVGRSAQNAGLVPLPEHWGLQWGVRESHSSGTSSRPAA
jgi:hypothetical protein